MLPFRKVSVPTHVSGQLVLHGMPGRHEDIEQCWNEVKRLPVRAIVCLATDHEIGKTSSNYSLAIQRATVPCVRWPLPIPEYGVPESAERVLRLADRVAQSLKQGDNILVHCRAGIGRTGTFAALVLMRLGVPLEDALHRVQAAGSGPENDSQYAFLESMRPKTDGWFYVSVTLLVILVNLLSFVPSLVDGSTRTVELPLASVALTHAVVSVAWLLIFLAQVTLIAAGRPAFHRRLGVVGVLLSAAFIGVTWVALVEGARRGFDLSGDLVPRGASVQPSTFLAPANALVPIGVLVGAAVWYRQHPAVHKRLMLLAILTSTGAPIAHLVGHWPALRAYPVINPISSLLLLSLLAIHDRVSERRIHPVSLWGSISVFAWLTVFFIVIVPTSAWENFAAWSVR